jgi:CRISPR-associated protein Csb1
MSAFIEATNVRVAASGGAKIDHVHPGRVAQDPKNHFGNIIFARDEYVAEKIECHVNLDLAQIRGYGLGDKVENLLVLLALYRLRKLLDGDLRLRTACDLEPVDRKNIIASRPTSFALPTLDAIESTLETSIEACNDLMTHTTSTFEDKLEKAKDEDKKKAVADDGEETDDDSSDSGDSYN